MPPRSLDEADRIRLVRAFGFATSWHRLDAGTVEERPLLAHLMRVAAATLERDAPIDEVIAALVHRGPGEARSLEERRHRERTIADLLGEQVLVRARALGSERTTRPGPDDG